MGALSSNLRLPGFNVLGVRAHAINMQDALGAFEAAITQNQKVYSHALGVAGVMEGWRNPRLRDILNHSYLNTPDGMPLVWLARHYGFRNVERVYGPDLFREVCRYSRDKGWRHFFYGAGVGVAPLLKQKMEEQFPGIQVVGTYTPPFRDLTAEELQDLHRQVNALQPDIFWISLSTPRQLYFMFDQLAHIDAKVLCAVGFAFDVNAGIKKDSPEWIKRAGLQWLHRLMREPRLWRRYLRDNPLFAWEIFLQLCGLKTFALSPPAAPQPEPAVATAELPAHFSVLGTRIAATSIPRLLALVDRWLARGEHRDVHFCTCDTVLQCRDSAELAGLINTSGLAVPDGMPLVWLGRWQQQQVERVYGPDFMLALCAHGQQRGYRHFFYGGTAAVLESLEHSLRARYPHIRIVGRYAPPFRALTPAEEAQVVEQINQSGADIVWCGLGTPKQDVWVSGFKQQLQAPVLLAVGAAFNFHSGMVRQAPRWMMRAGLEWLFRLLMEPRRLWRRYLVGNSRFIFLVLREYWRRGK